MLTFSSSLSVYKYRKNREQIKEVYVGEDLFLYLLSRLKSRHSQNFIPSIQKVLRGHNYIKV